MVPRGTEALGFGGWVLGSASQLDSCFVREVAFSDGEPLKASEAEPLAAKLMPAGTAGVDRVPPQILKIHRPKKII